MRNCILHIGLHRTGSTSTQDTLAANAVRLAKAGISYPLPLQRGKRVNSQRFLALSLSEGVDRGRNDDFGQKELDALLGSTKAEHVVLSSEAFSLSSVTPSRLESFLDMIRGRGFGVTVVAFVRPQPDLANSVYVQQVKTFHTKQAFAPELARYIKRDRLLLSNRLGLWEKQRGIRFVALPFTRSTTGANIAATVLEAGGVPRDQIAAAGMTPANVVNENTGRTSIAAIRYLATHHADREEVMRRHAFMPFMLRELTARGWNADRFSGLDQDRADAIADLFEAENEAFAQRNWGRGWRQTFSSEYAKRWTRNEMSLEDLPPELVASFEDFSRTIMSYRGVMGRLRDLFRRAVPQAGPAG